MTTELGRVVAEALVAYRRRHRLSQSEVAALLGWPQTSVSRLERGVYDPKLRTVEYLAEHLGLVVELRLTDATPVTALERRLLKEVPVQEERRYIGSESPPPTGSIVHVLGPDGRRWRLPHIDQGASNLTWGAPVSGSDDLALSILVDALEEVWTPGRSEPDWRPASGESLILRMVDDFMKEVISKLPRTPPVETTVECWQLRQQDVLAWVDEWKVKHPGIRPKRQ